MKIGSHINHQSQVHQNLEDLQVQGPSPVQVHQAHQVHRVPFCYQETDTDSR